MEIPTSYDIYAIYVMSFIVLILSIHNAGGRHSEHHLHMLGILDLELPVGVQETQSWWPVSSPPTLYLADIKQI